MKKDKLIFAIKTIITIGIVYYAINMYLTKPNLGAANSTLILGLAIGVILHMQHDEINGVISSMVLGLAFGAFMWMPAFIISLFTQYSDREIYNYTIEIVLVLCALRLFFRKDLSYLKYNKYLAELDYPDDNEQTIVHRDRYGQRTGETVIKDNNAVHYNKYGQRTGESHLKK